MISNALKYELYVCIGLIIAYFAYFIVKYRKNEGFLLSFVWGILAFFVANAMSNVVFELVARSLGLELLKKMPYLGLILKTLTLTLGVVFAASFAFKMLAKRGKFFPNNTEDVVGTVAGSGILFTPLNAGSYLLFFVQNLVNISVINRNPTQEELGTEVTLEMLEKTKEALLAIDPMFFVSIALSGIATALAFKLAFRLVGKNLVQNKEATTAQNLMLPALVFLASQLIINFSSAIGTSNIIQTILFIVEIIVLFVIDMKFNEVFPISVVKKKGNKEVIDVDYEIHDEK